MTRSLQLLKLNSSRSCLFALLTGWLIAPLISASAAPAITGLSPTEGSPGTSVIIQGTDLIGVTTVRFNGIETSFSFFGNQIFTSVPDGATTGFVTVDGPSGTAQSPDVFTVTSDGNGAPPVVTGFSPASGFPGTRVTLSGSNLASATSVRLGAVETSFSLLNEQLVVTVPEGASPAPFTVTTPAGETVTDAAFVVLEAALPEISAFDPTEGIPGSPVQIAGVNLENVQEVRFGGVSATFSVFTEGITAVVPEGATTGPITVVTTGGEAVSQDEFRVIEPVDPLISEIFPSSGEVGSEVFIRGSGLDDALTVNFGEIEASFSTFTGEIRAIVPEGASTGPITVVTESGSVTSTEPFQVLGQPTITSISPVQGPPGTAVTLTGDFLQAIASVTVGGVAAEFAVQGDDLIVTVPPDAVTGPIEVTGPGGTAISDSPFTVEALTLELTVRRVSESLIELSWPAGTAALLQWTPSLGVPTDWQVLEPPDLVESEGFRRVTVSSAEGMRFFRLAIQE